MAIRGPILRSEARGASDFLQPVEAKDEDTREDGACVVERAAPLGA